ncbi:TlpA family protein disulfide reductase [Neptuniibacter caesariensis]|uniref:Thioredoxin family protein n=1 Tax=Neptuniibacter caesariensis TaxID=207954 RepID=A0A7U8C1X4_NEPCE|nr:TlpA disulfide reductase family protein [Neptuniibacter caesariensis]EAR59684.1 thioredoxin family protein [Oceanospirillum sp. MED92] [Neptuniibacter caesariensis]
MKLIKLLAITALLMIQASYAKSNQEFYSLSFENAEQETVEFSQFKGKVILLNFWATWCPPCIREMPSMQRLKTHLTDQPFEIVAINAGESATTVSSFLMELDEAITFSILLDQKSRSFREFGIRGLPMTLLIDKQGKLVETILGEREWDSEDSIKKIEQLIN